MGRPYSEKERAAFFRMLEELESERIRIKRKDFFEAIDKHNEEVIARRAKKKLSSPENSC